MRQYRKYCKNGERPIDRARRIALKHSQQLVDEANSKLSTKNVDNANKISTREQDLEIEKLKQRLNKSLSMKGYDTPDVARR